MIETNNDQAQGEPDWNRTGPAEGPGPGQAALIVTTAERHFGRWHPWLLCALRTGMRLGELLALQWGDIDWNNRFIAVRRNIVRGTLTTPKSHRRRRVEMTPQLADVLLAWRRVQRKRWLKKGEAMPEWVFPSLTGTPVEERNVRHVLKRVLEKAGLRHIRIHDLRHTYATLLLHAGAPITYVSAQLGHRDASITLRVYAHYLPSTSQREVDRLDTPQPSATPAQPEAAFADQCERPKFFGLSGEPPRNRTENPQIKSQPLLVRQRLPCAFPSGSQQFAVHQRPSVDQFSISVCVKCVCQRLLLAAWPRLSFARVILRPGCPRQSCGSFHSCARSSSPMRCAIRDRRTSAFPSIVFGMDPDPRPLMRRTTCPKCHSIKALITTMSFGGDHGCYCPDCGHSWDCEPGSAPMRPSHFSRVIT